MKITKQIKENKCSICSCCQQEFSNNETQISQLFELEHPKMDMRLEVPNKSHFYDAKGANYTIEDL